MSYLLKTLSPYQVNEPVTLYLNLHGTNTSWLANETSTAYLSLAVNEVTNTDKTVTPRLTKYISNSMYDMLTIDWLSKVM